MSDAPVPWSFWDQRSGYPENFPRVPIPYYVCQVNYSQIWYEDITDNFATPVSVHWDIMEHRQHYFAHNARSIFSPGVYAQNIEPGRRQTYSTSNKPEPPSAPPQVPTEEGESFELEEELNDKSIALLQYLIRKMNISVDMSQLLAMIFVKGIPASIHDILLEVADNEEKNYYDTKDDDSFIMNKKYRMLVALEQLMAPVEEPMFYNTRPWYEYIGPWENYYSNINFYNPERYRWSRSENSN